MISFFSVTTIELGRLRKFPTPTSSPLLHPTPPNYEVRAGRGKRKVSPVKPWMQGIELGKEVVPVLLGLELERMGLRLGGP